MRRIFGRRERPKSDSSKTNETRRSSLREFVYLDDVSLRSLLASQKGELTEQVTDLLSQADEAELAGTIGASNPIAKAELRSRYQATKSQGTQTSRKAVAQSLFRELRELDWIEIPLRLDFDAVVPGSPDQLVASGGAVAVGDLRRGTLVEIEVELLADPIFRFSTIASELAELAQDFPELLDQPGAQEGFGLLVPGNRFLQRFLAGLVPVRARATSHGVVSVGGTDYVVPLEHANAAGLATRPFFVVGVTEQSSYWRDVRRVLFSGSQFTMLCRVGRDGLASKWEPVKLAEVLKEVLPTFPDLIADVGRTGLAMPQAPQAVTPSPTLRAIECFIAAVEEAAPPGLTSAGIASARDLLTGTKFPAAETVAAQNEAFRLVIDVLSQNGCTWSGDEWAAVQSAARESAGMVLFDQPQQEPNSPTEAERDGGSDELLLDTEVIAIYW